MSISKKNLRQRCVICARLFTGHGNNALPVKEGKCCDMCNLQIVIPARYKLHKEHNA